MCLNMERRAGNEHQTLAREWQSGGEHHIPFLPHAGGKRVSRFRTALAVSCVPGNRESDPPIADDDPVAIQVRHIYDSCLNALRETYQLLKPSLLDEAVRRLMLADRILVLARANRWYLRLAPTGS